MGQAGVLTVLPVRSGEVFPCDDGADDGADSGADDGAGKGADKGLYNAAGLLACMASGMGVVAAQASR